LIDWWAEGYSNISRIVKEISDITVEPTVVLEIDDLLRIKEYTTGGWAVFRKINNNQPRFSDNYLMVGREKGTIQLSEELYKTDIVGVGFDNTQSFDSVKYDVDNALELRYILQAVKEDIFIGDYAVEWNKLFFTSIRYVFAEQQYVDWAFKTSFLNATHNVGNLEQKLNYKNDNLSSFQEYINEVKPYRTTVREYISKYINLESTPTAISDFDLPPAYSETEGRILPVNRSNNDLQEYPWKDWIDNLGYSIVSIEVSDSGEEYSSIPSVLIEGNGTGATAQAYIANGKLAGIKVLTAGSGYTKSPIISIVGGNRAGAKVAKAVAILGNSSIRTFNLGIKFDRISKMGLYLEYTQTQIFIINISFFFKEQHNKRKEKMYSIKYI
jgi:hypothetical protein